jgi:hypothetical protein
MNRIRIGIGLTPWIRISIEANAYPQHQTSMPQLTIAQIFLCTLYRYRFNSNLFKVAGGAVAKFMVPEWGI